MMRITFAVTMVLFLAPTVYVVKYYAVDRPRESALAALPISDRAASADDLGTAYLSADYLPTHEKRARIGLQIARTKAIRNIGSILREPGIGYKRPIECLLAKATLADLAAKDPDLGLRAVASEELEKVAQGGAVLRR